MNAIESPYRRLKKVGGFMDKTKNVDFENNSFVFSLTLSVSCRE